MRLVKKANRKLKALGENKRSVWFGLGMFGINRLDGCSSYLLGAALEYGWIKSIQNHFPGL